MATLSPKYVSIFKIDGVPILPPLMTVEKRTQMQKYRDMALHLQNVRKKEQKICRHSTPLEPSCTSIFRHGHSHIPQPQTPRKPAAEPGLSTGASKRERMDKLRQTDTLVYDNRANSIILTLEGFEEETEFQSVEIERPQILDQNENKVSPEVSKSPAKEELSQTPSKPQPYAAFIPIPSICVNPPTPCVPNNPICETSPPKRLCSPTLKAEAEAVLIRSNSFTLDGPSSALLEHIKNQKQRKSTATQDTVESKAKRVQKADVKAVAKPPSSAAGGHFPSNTIIFKAKRSPYELKPSSKTKLGRKHKFAKPVTPKKLPLGNGGDSCTNLLSTSKTNSKLDILKDIEEQHRARFLELVRQQQVEQKLLQEQFETQQKMLLEQLSAKMAKVQMQSPPSTSTPESVQSSPSLSPEQDSLSARLSPRRRLFPEKAASSCSTTARDASPSSQTNNSNSNSNNSRRLEMKKQRQWAATKINAFARGFLVRRLFSTDYVQRIVQTIKDTLIFVLSLHLETSNDMSEDNVKLKARLLQQLTSASRTLHSVFMETTVKERMEIIARDRKYMQAKLMNMKRSPRIMG